VAIESDGKMAITGSNDQTVRIWELPGGDCRAELRGHEHVVECVEFIPASLNSSVEELTKMAKPIAVAAIAGPTVRFAVSGSRDKSIRLWDIATGQCIHVFVSIDIILCIISIA
jgi:platelet-activating factor acetylhydrolase IB subunit alpha